MAALLPFVMILGWMALALAGYPLFHGDRSLSFKRRYYAPFVLLVGSLGILLLAFHQPWSPIVSVPLFGLLTYRQIRDMRFCETCARPSVNRRDQFCARCGDRLPDDPRV